MSSVPEHLYNKYFKSIDFERLGLFKCIKETFKSETVIYIGSSIHITPSFVFQNVTYLDRSEMSKEFFSHLSDVKNIIKSNKEYQLEPYLCYKHQDYLKYIPKKQYDLCISIFTSNSTDGVMEYIKPGGLLIFLPLSDVLISQSEKLSYLGHIKLENRYIFKEGRPSGSVKTVKNRNKVFIESNIYSVYRRG